LAQFDGVRSKRAQAGIEQDGARRGRTLVDGEQKRRFGLHTGRYIFAADWDTLNS
jgi:hypothetical protein